MPADASPRAPRLRPWTIAALIVAAWLAVLGFTIGGTTVSTVVSDFGLAAAALGAGGICLATARRETNGERRFWFLLGLSGLAWGSGQPPWPSYHFGGP